MDETGAWGLHGRWDIIPWGNGWDGGVRVTREMRYDTVRQWIRRGREGYTGDGILYCEAMDQTGAWGLQGRWDIILWSNGSDGGVRVTREMGYYTVRQWIRRGREGYTGAGILYCEAMDQTGAWGLHGRWERLGMTGGYQRPTRDVTHVKQLNDECVILCELTDGRVRWKSSWIPRPCTDTTAPWSPQCLRTGYCKWQTHECWRQTVSSKTFFTSDFFYRTITRYKAV